MTAREPGGDVATSKFLAYVLRHNPASIGLALDGAGWAEITDLLSAASDHGRPLTRAAIGAVVNSPGKKRFEITGTRIRAAQGHSVAVDLGLAPVVPPDVLFHGTVERFLDAIRAEGLRPMSRTHVHLSADIPTAAAVGTRRGAPVILRIDATGMHAAGYQFFQASNGVWLTAHVPAPYISHTPRGS